jgi:hypothetical protein
LDNQHGGVLLVDGYLVRIGPSVQQSSLGLPGLGDGREKWAERAIGQGSLTWADGLFYLYGERKRVALARATPDEFELISQFELPPGGQGEAGRIPWFAADGCICGTTTACTLTGSAAETDRRGYSTTPTIRFTPGENIMGWLMRQNWLVAILGSCVLLQGQPLCG